MSAPIRSELSEPPVGAETPLIVRLLKTLDRLDPDKLGALWDAQSRGESSVEQSVMSSGLADEREIAEAYARHYLLPLFDLPLDQPPPIDTGVGRLIPAALCRDHLIAPLADDGHTLDVAILAPESLRLADPLKRLTGRQMRAMFAPRSVIQRLLTVLYPLDDDITQTPDALASPVRDPEWFDAAECPDFQEIDDLNNSRNEPMQGILDGLHDRVLQASQPVAVTASTRPAHDRIAGYVDAIFEQALHAGASDLHLEPYGDRSRLRMRAGGRLTECIASPPISLLPAIIARLKTLARLDAADCSVPHSGTLRLSGSGGRFDVQVHTCPTVQGEKVVMRLRKQLAAAHDLRRLGLDDRQRRDLLDALRSPHGMVLVAGPAGSGKSTTLYACLNHLTNPQTNLCSVEDPVECRLSGVNQLQVCPAVGLTFAAALRTVLRQDADAVMVGELRDAETAEIACRAAGSKLVLSALSTADAPASIAQLQQWGCDGRRLADSLRLLVSQRLIRQLCPACRDPYLLDRAAAQRHGMAAGRTLYRAAGCDRCDQTGYQGHLVVFEVVPLTGALSQWLQRGASPDRWAQAVGEAGIQRLRHRVREQMLRGVTSLEEAVVACRR